MYSILNIILLESNVDVDNIKVKLNNYCVLQMSKNEKQNMFSYSFFLHPQIFLPAPHTLVKD